MAPRRIALNVVWNWAGMVIGLLSGFVVAPFLVQRLGQSGYGLWVLIASLTGYFGLLDLGIRNAVGRNMAFARAKGDTSQVNALLCTALVLLTVPALLALGGTGLALLLFFRLFAVPPTQVAVAQLALVVVGLHLALAIWLNVFDATLWALQRFDLLNAIDIPAALVRVGLTLALIHDSDDLPLLALLTLATSVLAAGGKAILSFWVEPTLRLGWRHLSADAARTLLGFGVWSWLLAATRLLTNQLGPVIIGNRLGIAWVTPFSVAARLVGYMTALLVAAAGVLTPVATTLHAEERLRAQQRLVLIGSTWCLALALFFGIGCLFLGKPFLILWMGAEPRGAYEVLLVLAAGETLALGQGVSHSVIVGMGRHRPLALAGLIENGAGVLLALGWVHAWELIGVALALALTAFLCRGMFPLVLTCRLLQLPLNRYLLEALVPALAATLVPALVLAGATSWQTPATWPELLGVGIVYAACWGASCWFLFGKQTWTCLAPEGKRLTIGAVKGR